jgi:hypothetical protein
MEAVGVIADERHEIASSDAGQLVGELPNDLN